MFERDQQEAVVESLEREEECINRALVIGANCITEICGNLLLVAVIKSTVPRAVIEGAVVIIISREQEERLIRAGVRECPVIPEISRRSLGANFDLLGAFIVGNQVINIFEREPEGVREDRDFRDDRDDRDDRDCDRPHCSRLVLVSKPLIPVIRS